MSWPMVKLGEVLVRAERYENRDDLKEYIFAGTYSFGRGVFIGEKKLGATFRLPKIQRIKEDDFVYCKIMAWEGAFGLVPKEANNCVLSGAFVAYEINRSKILPQFLSYYFKIQNHWENIGQLSTGTNVRRKSLHPNQFEKAQIPLPPLPEQKRIVARIEELAAKVEEAKGLREKVIKEKDAIIDATINTLFSKITSRSKIKDIIDINYGEGLKKQDRIGAGQYDVYGSGGLVGKHNRSLNSSPFVVIGRKGSAGEINYASKGGWVIDTAYYAIPKNEDVLLTKFLFYALKATDLKTETITTAIPGLNRESIYNKEIGLVSLPEQRCIVSYLDSLQSKVDELKKLQAETQKELNALMPSILDKAFKGEL